MRHLFRHLKQKFIFFLTLILLAFLPPLLSRSYSAEVLQKSNWNVPKYVDEDVDPNQQTLGLVLSPSGVGQIKTWSSCDENWKCELRTSFSRTGGNTWSKPRAIFSFKGLIQSTLSNSTDGKVAVVIVNAMTLADRTQDIVKKAKFILHSYNGGASWSKPFLIDSRTYGINSELPQVLWNEQINGGPLSSQIRGSRDFKVQALTWTNGYIGSSGTLINRAMISLSRDFGRSWSEPISLRILGGEKELEPTGYLEGTFRSDVYVSGDGSKMIVFWADWRGAIYTRTSLDSGKTWFDESQICTGGYEAFFTTSDDLGTVHGICPKEIISPTQQFWTIQLTSSKDSGLSWSEHRNLPFKSKSRIEISPNTSVLVMSKSRLFVALTEKVTGNIPTSTIWTSYSQDGGITWNEFRRENSSDVAFLSGAIGTTLSGGLHLGWWEKGTFVWNRSKNFGKTWEEKEIIGGGEMGYPTKLAVATGSNSPALIYISFQSNKFKVTTRNYSSQKN